MTIVRRLLLIVLVVGVVVALLRASERAAVVRIAGGTVTPRRAGRGPAKPVPVSPGFQGCPAEGDGGDRQLNRLKNRLDSAEYEITPFSSVLALTWPRGTTKRSRAEWSEVDAVTVAANEGLPVAVEGYFVAARQEGPEATNCHGADATFRDWHLWLAATPGKDRRRSVVVETTPAVRARHPEWTLTDMRRLIRDSSFVRVSGWLMLDEDHPEQLGKTRGTLWEIHPVMRIEVQRAGQWVRITSDSG